MWSSAISCQVLEQSISNLQKLNEVPELPKENVLGPEIDSMHRLSISRESEIANNFAFLSAISDDGQKVTATCIEEHPNGAGITIRIASNTGDLSEVTSGFNALAKVLEKAARRENSKSDDRKALLQQVVGLDFYRILSRLRSRHAKRSIKTAGKAALITQLTRAAHDKSVVARSGFSESSLNTFRNAAKSLEALFSRLESISDLVAEKISAQNVTEEIVEAAYDLTLGNNLSSALQTFSADPSLKKHLLQAIGKIGRYYSASCELVSAARDKKHRLFQNIVVEPFQIFYPYAVQKSSAKVHAEIKLLFYYELHPNSPRPRVICASKSACYLCNLFFHLHGDFHVPRTHGRLYGKWTLPYWLEVPKERHQDLRVALTKLKRTLDNKTRNVSGSKGKYSYPNESCLLPTAHWTSSGVSENSSSNSTFTIQLQPTLTEEMKPSNEVFRSTSTLRRTLLEPNNDVYEAPKNQPQVTVSRALSSADCYKEDMSTLDAPSLITVRYSQLPYSQSITAKTPSLYLQLDALSITLEFIQVFSGYLSIAETEGDAVSSDGCRVIGIKDIPTAEELELNCLYDSNSLAIQFQTDQASMIRFNFMWDDAVASVVSSKSGLDRREKAPEAM